MAGQNCSSQIQCGANESCINGVCQEITGGLAGGTGGTNK